MNYVWDKSGGYEGEEYFLFCHFLLGGGLVCRVDVWEVKEEKKERRYQFCVCSLYNLPSTSLFIFFFFCLAACQCIYPLVLSRDNWTISGRYFCGYFYIIKPQYNQQIIKFFLGGGVHLYIYEEYVINHKRGRHCWLPGHMIEAFVM